MKRHTGSVILWMMISTISVLFFPAQAVQGAVDQPDIQIQIHRMEQTLNMIDGMAASGSASGGAAPTQFIRAMLQGTDWIDVNRSIVIGLWFKDLQTGQKPMMAALIPFARPNDNFRMAYNAVSGDDYYIVPLPPATGQPVTEQMEKGLVAGSKASPQGVVSVEIAAAQLVEKARPQVQDMLLGLQQGMPASQQKTAVSPLDTKKAIEGMLSAAAQMQKIKMGMDITEKEVAISTVLEAVKGTDLSRLFVRSTDSHSSFMAGYFPSGQIRFKSGSYEIKGMFDFFNKMFGEFYKNVGVDLSKIETIATNFTGEAAGGMSFGHADGRQKIEFEMIVVRKALEQSGETFLETTYMPWLMDYGRNLTDYFNTSGSTLPMSNLFSKTPETAIDGQRVFGIKGKIPVASSGIKGMDGFELEMRISAVDPFVLTASSDERLGQLIQTAKTLKRQPADGPLMQAEVDLGRLLQAIGQQSPKFSMNPDVSLSKLGSLFYTVDMDAGSLTSEYRIQREDIQSLISYFKNFAVSPQTAAAGGYSATGPSFTGAQAYSGAGAEPQRPRAPLTKDSPRYWLNKGLLFATYGNDKEAIRHFKKSIDLDPKNSAAHFNLGLSYSEIGEYEKAISAISQAIALSPENGDYYYGRGWVLQFSGDPAAAFKDIQKAAELGSMDAKNYLQRRTGEQSGE